LDQRQEELDARLAELKDPSSQKKSLRDRGDRDAIAEGLVEQRQRLEDLLDRVRQTVVEAEESEPLLADKLYETFRQTQQQQTPRTLETAARSLERGLLEDAIEREQLAREGVRQFREGVEQAAESVLGDETEALRRAEQTVRQLVRELRDEAERSQQGIQSASSAAGDASREDEREASQDASPETEADGQARRGSSQRDSRPGDESSQGRNPQQESSRQDRRQPGSQDTPTPGDSQRGEQPSGQPASAQQPNGNTPGGGQPSDADEAARNDSQPGSQPPQGQRPGAEGSRAGTPDQPDRRNGPRRAALNSGGGGGLQEMLNQLASPEERRYAPLTGQDFIDWSDRLRDVEEMVSDPELRGDAARIRDRAREIRRDLRRHSRAPNWDLVKLQVLEPLAELRDRLAQEILRRSGQRSMVPIDRDPVPPQFQQQVRRYYEQLGSGR
jgi:hypothetical protein